MVVRSEARFPEMMAQAEVSPVAMHGLLDGSEAVSLLRNPRKNGTPPAKVAIV